MDKEKAYNVMNDARVVISVIPKSYVAGKKKSLLLSLSPMLHSTSRELNEMPVFLIPSHPSSSSIPTSAELCPWD